MNSLSIVGRVIKAKTDTNQNGKTVGKVRIEVRKKFGDKTWSTRVDCHVYGQDALAVGSIPEGATAWATGEASAYTSEWKGKTYANLQLTGKVGVVDAGNFEEHKQRYEQQEMPKAAPTAAATAASDDDSDVPF